VSVSLVLCVCLLAIWRVIRSWYCVCLCVCYRGIVCVCVSVTVVLCVSVFLLAIWRVIRSWLTPAQRDRTLHVNQAQLSEYVASDQLEPHMTDIAADTATP